MIALRKSCFDCSKAVGGRGVRCRSCAAKAWRKTSARGRNCDCGAPVSSFSRGGGCRSCYVKAIKANARKRSDLKAEHFTIKSPNGLWAWHANGTPSGAKIRLERWIWEEARGEVPAGHLVQRVDASKPASLDNLVLKTKSAIMEDAYEAKRNRPAPAATRAKLKPCDVIEIRNLYREGRGTHRSLAARFGVSCRTIGRICKMQRWSKLEDKQCRQ